MVIVNLDRVTKIYGTHVIFDGVSWEIQRGRKIGLVGPNGAGKSTLFRIIRGEQTPTGGTIKIGPSIKIGYYAQEHQTLDFERTPVEEIRLVRPMYESDAYGFLGKFLFDYEMARKPIAMLSGGEKSRLQLAKLMLTEPNFLLLDEPTNNLDIRSIEVLEEVLEDFAGTVFVISHDRYFLDKVVNRVVELADGELTEYLGGYTEYRLQVARARDAIIDS
jgi:ATP-binding cassette subfamily F protein 3